MLSKNVSVAGTSMAVAGAVKSKYDDIKVLIGSEGGLVSRYLVPRPQREEGAEAKIRALETKDRGAVWQPEAVDVLSNVAVPPGQERRLAALKQHVDDYAVAMKSSNKIFKVFGDHIFSSKPPITEIYPPFRNTQQAKFSQHHGAVLATASSPFNAKLFLTSGADGLIRLYDLQGTGEPKATFEPSFGDFVTDVEFSLTRPCVFAAVSSAGTLYIYDLLANKLGPVEVIQYEKLEEDGSLATVPSIFR